MTAQTLTLAEFLLDRIAEEEAAARAVEPLGYTVDMGGNRRDETFTFGRVRYASEDGMPQRRGGGNEAQHFSRWDPARVLAECAAKRRIVELHHDRTPPDMVAEYIEDCEPWTPECAECSCYGDCRVELPCPTLRALASVYADHPLYRSEWEL